jgi:hypothetical protein
MVCERTIRAEHRLIFPRLDTKADPWRHKLSHLDLSMLSLLVDPWS